MARPKRRYEDMSPSRVRWLQALALAKSALVGALVLAAYYLLPLDNWTGAGVTVLIVGLLLIGLVVALEVRAILNAPFPRLRGFQTIIVGVPLLLVIFAAVFYLTGLARPDSFSQPMNKVDAIYFTITVFSTVGFGDITAKTGLARTLVSVQMIFNLVVIGLIAKVLLEAVDVGQKKRSAEHHPSSAPVDRPDPATG